MTELTHTTNGSRPESTANVRLVEGFLYALQDQDFDALAAALDDDLLYENVGFSRMRGGRKVVKLFRRMEGKFGFEVKFHRVAADGNAVLTERTDALIFGPLRIQFWVCGVFEVHDGRITLWRDYFDTWDFLKGTARGLIGVVVPSVRATL